jgi:hypothetical protein
VYWVILHFVDQTPNRLFVEKNLPIKEIRGCADLTYLRGQHQTPVIHLIRTL